MAYLKLWPTSDWDLAGTPFKTSSKLILEAKTVKCCEKNAKANPQHKKKSNFYQLKIMTNILIIIVVVVVVSSAIISLGPPEDRSLDPKTSE